MGAAVDVRRVAGDEGRRHFVFVAPDRAAVITCEGTEIRVGLAPDVATARALTR